MAYDHQWPPIASFDPGPPLAGLLFKGLHEELLVLHGRPPEGFSFEPRKQNWPSEIGLKHYSGGMSFRREVGYSCWIGLPRSKGRLIPRGARMWILHVEYESSDPPAGRDFIFETKEAALLKPLEFYRGAGINVFTKCRHIEGLSGERIEQTEIEEWCRKQPKALR